MSNADFHLPQRGLGSTARRDRWWVQPLTVFCVLSGFIVYATWAALQGKHYFAHANGEHYLSPFYSPLLYGAEHEPYWIA